MLDEFLQWEAERRPSAQQALKYPFFQIVKRSSESVHIPTSVLTKHHHHHHHHHQHHPHQHHYHQHQPEQPLQLSLQEQRNQTLPSSNVSIDDSSKDSFISNLKQYGSQSNHYANGLSSKNTNAKFVSNIDDSIDRTNYENDKNITIINDEPRSFNTTKTNKYHADIDDIGSDAAAPTTLFANRLDDTNAMSTLKSRNSQNVLANQLNGHTNQNHESNELLTNGIKPSISNGDLRRESINGFNSRRNSRINDENHLLNEKISDIFVNRNPGKLYNNVGGSIYNNLLYNGAVNSNAATENVKRSQDLPRSKAFFLQENESTTDSGYGSKVYNIFSKQSSKAHEYGNDLEDDEDNSYLLVKIPSSVKKQQKKNISVLDQTNSFEDDDLDKLLG